MWVTLFPRMLKDAKTIGTNHCASLPSCEGKSYSRKTRRIVSSEDLGVVLMGTLKVSIYCYFYLQPINCNYKNLL